MPRTAWATLAIILFATPCFGGLIADAPQPVDGERFARSKFEWSAEKSTEMPRRVGEIRAWVPPSTFAPAVENTKVVEEPLAPPASINSLHFPKGGLTDKDDAPLTPATSRANTTSKQPVTQARSRKTAGPSKVSVAANRLAAQITVPEPMMFAFVAFMVPVLRPRRARRLASRPI